MKLEKRKINMFLLLSLLVIVCESLNSFYLVKSIELYNDFNANTNGTLHDYITVQMISYFGSVILFVIFSVYNYFLNEKLRINILYKGIWSLFIIGNILFKIFVTPPITIFSYISIIIQFILLIGIIRLGEREA